MEGKELHNDDDLLKSGSDKSANEESDEFGLPETPFDDQEEEKGDDAATKDADAEGQSKSASAYADESKSPVGLIVTLIIIGVVAIVIAAYFLFLKKPNKPVVEKKPAAVAVDSTLLQPPVEEPVVEEPKVVEKPVDEEPPKGDIQTLTSKTGKYYVILASFVDVDLAMDYAKKLSSSGVNTTILSPEAKGFHRLALAEEFNSFGDANIRVGEVQGNYGSEIWVLKY